eukprot:jgi/Botrbrau1/3294/Bobra.174_1s0057.1
MTQVNLSLVKAMPGSQLRSKSGSHLVIISCNPRRTDRRSRSTAARRGGLSLRASRDAVEWPPYDRKIAEKEAELLMKFIRTGGDTLTAKEILREAAFKKTAAPDQVVTAMAFLEDQEKPDEAPDLFLRDLEGTWGLVFSSPSIIEAWQYIPVQEELTIDEAGKLFSLRTDLGPLVTEFSATRWVFERGPNVMYWRFDGLRIKLFGWELVDRELEMERKWYSFFGYDGDVVAARSSSGVLTLLARKR